MNIQEKKSVICCHRLKNTKKTTMKNSLLSSSQRHSGYRFQAIIALIFFLYAFSNVSAQTGSLNFSGTWAFNEAKSSPSEGGFRMGAGSYVITQDGINLTVERTMTRPSGEEVKSTSKFTLDSKECSNTVFGTTIRKSIAQWSADGKSLSFSHVMNFERDGQTTEFKSTETWKINDSDKTLVMESVFNSPNGEMKTTNIYDKK